MSVDKVDKKDKLLVGISLGMVIEIVAIVLVAVDNSHPAVSPMDEGQRYIRRQEYEKAIHTYQRALYADPKNESAYLGLAQVYTVLGEYQEAIKILETGISYLPESLELWENLRNVKRKAASAGSHALQPQRKAPSPGAFAMSRFYLRVPFRLSTHHAPVPFQLPPFNTNLPSNCRYFCGAFRTTLRCRPHRASARFCPPPRAVQKPPANLFGPLMGDWYEA